MADANNSAIASEFSQNLDRSSQDSETRVISTTRRSLLGGLAATVLAAPALATPITESTQIEVLFREWLDLANEVSQSIFHNQFDETVDDRFNNTTVELCKTPANNLRDFAIKVYVAISQSCDNIYINHLAGFIQNTETNKYKLTRLPYDLIDDAIIFVPELRKLADAKIGDIVSI